MDLFSFQDQLNFHKFFGSNCLNRERKRLSTERLLVHSEALLYQEETGCIETEGFFFCSLFTEITRRSL